MRTFAKILMALGLMFMIVSLLLNTINAPGSPESVVSWINVGLGALMVALAAIYLTIVRRKHIKKQREDENKTEN